MSITPKIISDFEAVQRFSDILNFQITIPPALYLLYIWTSIILPQIIPQIVVFIPIIILGIIIVAAISFTPYIFYILIKEKRFGWIVTFFAMIIFPLIFGPIIFQDTLAFEASLLIPIGLFYFYCYLIKYSVSKWIKDYNWHKQLEEQRRESEEKKRDLLSGF
ncbi:MAG: hypothetical protein MUE91_07400 [Ignavibacteriaceae bacterium]|nr:hypothetical protein [Ignavibacteriaceae bacterium]MCU0414209.1 hypothetical protein [Ignavibacteriaceae bacterium]